MMAANQELAFNILLLRQVGAGHERFVHQLMLAVIGECAAFRPKVRLKVVISPHAESHGGKARNHPRDSQELGAIPNNPNVPLVVNSSSVACGAALEALLSARPNVNRPTPLTAPRCSDAQATVEWLLSANSRTSKPASIEIEAGKRVFLVACLIAFRCGSERCLPRAITGTELIVSHWVSFEFPSVSSPIGRLAPPVAGRCRVRSR